MCVGFGVYVCGNGYFGGGRGLGGCWLCLGGGGDSFDNASGVAYGDGVRRDIADDHRACADRAIVANSDAGEDSDAAANPAIVPNGDGACPLVACIALGGVCAMACGIDTDIGADKGVVADSDIGLVEDSEMEIGKEALAHADMFAVVAIERLIDKDMLVACAQDRLEHSAALV